MNKLRAYAELLRLSNVPTAVADVWMGMIVATGSLAPPAVSVPLTLASVLLYLGGMAMNDWFDAEHDAINRSTRPIPRGALSLSEARVVSIALLVGGVACSGIAGWAAKNVFTPSVAIVTVSTIAGYNRWHKLAPSVGLFLMPICRVMNLLLAMSVAGVRKDAISLAMPQPLASSLAAGMFLYILGLTLFAAKEETASRRGQLTLASLLSLLGLLTYASSPFWLKGSGNLIVDPFRWYLLWLVIALLIGRRYVATILQPTPRHVQAAVGNAIQGIILIDAALAWGYAGPFWGLAILALLPPTILMARFIPQT